MSQKRLGPQAPGWAAQENGKEMMLYPEDLGGQYFAVLFCLQLTSHTVKPFVTLSNFRIKWDAYFSKELCPLVFIVLNMFLHASAYGYVT